MHYRHALSTMTNRVNRSDVRIFTSHNLAWHTSNTITILLLCMRYENNTDQTP